MSRVYVIGAGIAGLAAAGRLMRAGRETRVIEATARAGGRCRSYFDERLGLEIDNGTHLMLSANKTILAMADGSELFTATRAAFTFYDVESANGWTLDLGHRRWPWVFSAPPGVNAPSLLLDCLKLYPDREISRALDANSPAWSGLWHPLVRAIMNDDPERASARVMFRVLRQTVLRGGHYSRPVLARNGLYRAIVAPALAGLDVSYRNPLRKIEMENHRARRLVLADGDVELGPGDAVVLAVPWRQAHELLAEMVPPPAPPGMIGNVHFRVTSPATTTEPSIAGITGKGALSGWLMRRGELASVTIGDNRRAALLDDAALAQRVWAEVSPLLGGGEMGAFRVIWEKSATFSCLPGSGGLRPGPSTGIENIFLAGDWTGTGLPATLEGAARSGINAAGAVLRAGN